MKKLMRAVINGVKGADFKGQYQEIKDIHTKVELAKFQKKYLAKLLLHSYKNVSYYHSILRDIGVVNDDKVDLSKFEKIPILTKEIIRENRLGIVSNDLTERKWYRNSSGGSTGEPISFIQDIVYEKWGNAAFYYWYKDILGIDEPSVKKTILWGSGRDLFEGGLGWDAKVVNWLNNTIFLNSFRMTESDMERYISVINSYKPNIIRGYSGSLYDLCRYAERKGIKIHNPNLVVGTAEMLSNEMRARIEKGFGVKVYNFYGSRETNNIAGECGKGLLHIFSFHNYLEVLDQNNQPVKEGDVGRVVITNLHNYSMPFIRYEIGDMAMLGAKECECGNPLPILKEISGRITDHFVRVDGAIISGSALTLTFNLKEWVRNFQIIQEDYEIIRILVVLKGTVSVADKSEIEDKMRFLLGEDCKIIWEFVDEIPNSPQGKHLYIRSFAGRYA